MNKNEKEKRDNLFGNYQLGQFDQVHNSYAHTSAHTIHTSQGLFELSLREGKKEQMDL